MIILRNKSKILLFVLIMLAATLSACNSQSTEVDINVQRTGFAQTADAQGTMTAAALPTATATQTLPPTATFTPTQEITPTPTGSTTDSEPGNGDPTSTTTSVVVGTDAARWMSNDPPDKTNFSPGEEFTVTWTLENVGTSSWSTNYYIQFSSGEQMDAEEKVFVPYPVAPNTNVQISVAFIAPAEVGEYQSSWKLTNAKDAAFYDFYIIIDVVEQTETEQPSPTTTVTSDTSTPTVTATPTATTEP